ncbi:MAG: iron-sulfur cluster insertion protein ErpA [Chloroflexi bacterium]|nr:iron-sulfur cluster insertion protein ErpA [Chloroflexota bacterium]
MLTMTDSAVSQLRRLLGQDSGSEKALRVYVTPGGCSGFSYGMSFDDERAEDDKTFVVEGVPVVVDAFSLQYIDGAQIDYTNSLMGGGFSVQNPNAVKSCSCGQSFDTAGGGGTAKPCG